MNGLKEIGNQPDRHALQLDLQQNKDYNLFSSANKMIEDVGNVELFKLFEKDPLDAVHSMLIIMERRHRLLHMRAFLA